MSAVALIAACHARACAPPPVGRGGSGGGGGSTKVKNVGRSTAPAAGPRVMPSQPKTVSSRVKGLLGRMKDKVTAKFRGGPSEGSHTVVQRSRRADTKAAGAAASSRPKTSRGTISPKGNRPDGRYEQRYIGKDLKHPSVVSAKAKAAKTGKPHYVVKEARGVLSHERKRSITTTEPQGSHLRVDPNGKVHQVLPKTIRVGGGKGASTKTAPAREMQPA